MHELKEAIKAELMKAQLKGIDNVSVEELGKVVDMYKDMCYVHYMECKEKHMYCEEEYWEIKKARYFMEMALIQEQLEEMNDESGEFGPERRYYDRWRYSNGRFAPKGRGRETRRRGYEEPPYYRMTPEMYRSMDEERYRDMDREMGRMYYSEGNSSGNRSSSSRSGSYGSNSGRDGKEGRSGMSRRSYMETKEMHKDNTPDSKQKKMQELEHYLNELGEDVKEMILDATPEEKQLLRTKLSNLATKM